MANTEASSQMVGAFTGTWKLDPKASDSMEPMLQFMGVPWAIRKLAMAAPPPTQDIILTKEDLTVTMNGFKKVTNNYKWGPEQNHNTPDGGVHKADVSVDSSAGTITLKVVLAGKGDVLSVYAIDDQGRLVVSMVLTKQDGHVDRLKRVFVKK